MTSRARSFQDLAKSIPDWEEKFQDLAFLEALVDRITEGFVSKRDRGTPETDVLLHLYKANAMRSLTACLAVAESPIEKIFLGQVVICFYQADPMLLMLGPHEGFLEDLSKALDTEVRVRALSKETGQPPGEIAREILDQKEFADHLWYPLVYRDFHGYEAVHMFPQYSFAGIGALEEKFVPLEGLRVDVFFTKLNDPRRFSLVVECDGYEWHKDRFIEDRQRDRAFRKAGIDILRYSGSEIVKDPISCAVDLFQYIESHWEFQHVLKGADA